MLTSRNLAHGDSMMLANWNTQRMETAAQSTCRLPWRAFTNAHAIPKTAATPPATALSSAAAAAPVPRSRAPTAVVAALRSAARRCRTRGDDKVWRQTVNPLTGNSRSNQLLLPWTSSPPMPHRSAPLDRTLFLNCDAPGSLRAAGPARTRSPPPPPLHASRPHTAQPPSAMRMGLFAPCGD